MNRYILLLLTGFACVLTACGGSSGESVIDSPSPSDDTTNAPPTVTIMNAQGSVQERSSITVTADANDSDGTVDSIVWSSSDTSIAAIVSSDNSSSVIDTQDLDADSQVTLTVTVTDDDGDIATDEVSFTVTDNQPPVVSGLSEVYPLSALDRLTITPVASDADEDSLILSITKDSGRASIISEANTIPIIIEGASDEGQDETTTFTVSASDGLDSVSATFEVFTPTASQTVISNIEEYGELDDLDNDPSSNITISVDAIDERGVLRASVSDFIIDVSSPSDAKIDDELKLQLVTEENVFDVTSAFEYDSVANTIKLREDAEESVTDLLTGGLYQLFITGIDTEGGLISIEIQFVFGFATVTGRLVDDQGNPYPGLEGESVSLIGNLTSFTFTATVNSGSEFEFSDIPEDTYTLSLLTEDLEVASSGLLIRPESEFYNIDALVIQLGGGNSKQSVGSALKTLSLQSPDMTRQRFHEQQERDIVHKMLSGQEPPVATLSVTSGTQGSAIVDDLSIDIPEDISTITIKTIVSSNEYPTYTTVNSEFNDTWQYTISVTGNVVSEQGNVNSSHASARDIVEIQTFDVSQITSGSISLYGSATNIGDSSVDTSVTIEVLTDFEGLVVSEFKHLNGLGIGKGRWHIGVGSNTSRRWQANLNYEPKIAMIDTATCNYNSGASFPINNIDIENKGNGNAILTMGFSSLATIPSNGAHGNVSCIFTASVEGETTQTEEPIIMEFGGGKGTIIPLTNNPNGDRYGGRDLGAADAWMRYSLRNFISQNTELVYNDASREHGGCFVKDSSYPLYNSAALSCSKAIYDHKTHRTGQSIDTLYPTGFISPANLLSLINSAQTNASAQSTLTTWLTEIRAGLTTLSNRSDVRLIYIAKAPWMNNFIMKGVDTNGQQIGALIAWQSPPSKLIPIKGHRDHIHIDVH